MCDNIQWIFSGVGTSLLGFICGGFVGYKIRDLQITRQVQKAGNNSNQIQELNNTVTDQVASYEKRDYLAIVNQSQVAGNDSTQIPIDNSSKRQ